MKHAEKTYTGVSGTEIFYQSWQPDSPRAVLQIAHGFAEHGGRYMNVVETMLSEGFAVYASDHRGNGRSKGQRNYADFFDQFVDDLRTLSGIITKDHPGLPLFLLGHSMGSTMAIRYAARYETRLRGLVLSGSGTALGGGANPLLRSMTGILSRITPRLMLPPGDLSAYISHDPAVIDAYANDPLRYGKKISARLAAEMIRAFGENARIAKSLTLPILFQAGGDDRLVLGAAELADNFTMQDKTILLYPGLYHEVYNEAEEGKNMALGDLSGWLNAHV